MAGEFMAAFQELQLDHEGQPDDVSAEFFDQPDYGFGRAAGRQEVVRDDYVVALADRVPVNFECVLAVFKVVAVAFDLRRQFLRLADGNEAGPQVIGQRRGENEAARHDADYAIDFFAVEMFNSSVDHGAQSFGVFE